MLVGRRADVLEAAASELGGGATFEPTMSRIPRGSPTDRTDREARRAPGILVNNAGIHLKKPAVDTTEAEFENVMTTHVTAAFAFSRAAAQDMIPRARQPGLHGFHGFADGGSEGGRLLGCEVGISRTGAKPGG